MPVTVKVNGVCQSLVHKGSNGVSIATIPDVCKTPSPGGPVPIPYPNISQSMTLAKGTTSVKADHGMMIAIKGSEFSLSNGDNPGVAGGIKSSTFMKESTWILYSFDVKMEGKGACRLTDKKFQNHENTVDLAGILQVPVGLLETDLKQIAKDCHDKVEADVTAGKLTSTGKPPNCAVKGTWKHKCCADTLAKKGHIDVKCEDSCGSSNCRLDVAVVDPPGSNMVTKIYDFKFNCSGSPKMSKAQEDKYDDEFPSALVILVGP
ncbi:MAG: DUF4150 domain-containing protein [Rhodocyclaceae bacterium]|nr:DUF4150 domain-containing protein [Rhodocyclaceae bacterium]